MKERIAIAPLVVTAKEAAEMFRLSLAAWWRLHADGKVPMPLRIGAKSVRWRISELHDWLEAGMPDRAAWNELRQAK